jgi:hypothetical protein
MLQNLGIKNRILIKDSQLYGLSLTRLDIPKLSVNPLLSQQIFMFAVLDDFSMLHYIDAVRIANGGKPMGDRHSSPIHRNVLQRFLNCRLSLVIHRRSRLIQNQDGWVFEIDLGAESLRAEMSIKLI